MAPVLRGAKEKIIHHDVFVSLIYILIAILSRDGEHFFDVFYKVLLEKVSIYV